MWDYSKKVMDHFLNPRNMGEMPDADTIGEIGNIVCGDALKLYLKLGNNERIIDAKFQTFGCASAIASSSALTEIIKGMTLDEALLVTDEDIAQYLGGLPEEKMHCSVMGKEALNKAIAVYRGQSFASEVEEGTIICKCFGITDKKIVDVVKEHQLTTVDEITHYTKAGGGCGQCKEKIQDLLDEFWHKTREKKRTSKPKTLTNIEKIKRIEETIAEDIRPVLMADRGDIELVDVIGEKILVRFLGKCSGCRAAEVTMTAFVQEKLREKVTPSVYVEEVKEKE
ncbi:Fe-S cluster assembly protein NifU [Chlamydiota bacterium]